MVGPIRVDTATAELTAVVELRAAADWGLSPALTADLYERAVPLEGLGALAVPAPAHALLVLARRLQAGGGRLDHRRLERARAALCQDSDALTAARELAKGWRCAGALEVLAADLDGSLRRSRRHQLLARDGIPSVPRWRSAVRAVRRQRARHRAG